MVKEKYRISITNEYVVSEEGDLYRLPYYDRRNGRRKAKMIIPFKASKSRTVSYDLRIDRKILRISQENLQRFFVLVPESQRRIIKK